MKVTKGIRGTEHLKWLREQAGFEEDTFLRHRGWKHTCDTPGSFWMWSKVVRVKGIPRTLLVDKEMAIRMEAWFEVDSGTCSCKEDGYTPDTRGCPLHDWEE